MTGVMGGLRAMTGVGGASGEEHQFEFVGAGSVLLQSTEVLMPEQAVGATPAQPGVPGATREPEPQVNTGPLPVSRASWGTSSVASACER